jgi:hypothetical protein
MATFPGVGRFSVAAIRKQVTDREPGSGFITAGSVMLSLLGAGLLYVSFSAQFTYIFAAKHQHAASIIQALMLDVGMVIFAVLGLGLSKQGKPSRAERTLIMVCALLSAAMNYAASDTASPRSVVAYTAAPVFLAIVTDRVIAVVRRHVLGIDEASAWSTLGHTLNGCARVLAVILLYGLRFALAAPETAKGLRRVVLNAAPLPEIPKPPAPAAVFLSPGPEDKRPGAPRCRVRYDDESIPCGNPRPCPIHPRCEVPAHGVPGVLCDRTLPCPDHPVLADDDHRMRCQHGSCPERVPCPVHAVPDPVAPTKKLAFLALYRAHQDYGDRKVASKVAAELAPAAGLQPGTARTYVYDEIDRMTARLEGEAS